MVENDLERVQDRGDQFESKIAETSAQVEQSSTSLRELEELASKNGESEDKYETEIHRLTETLKNQETRAEFAERSVDKLESNIDHLEEALFMEKDSYKVLS